LHDPTPWQLINALPKDCQRRVGQLFVGNKNWAETTLAARKARLKQEEEKNRKASDAFWRERMHMMCGT